MFWYEYRSNIIKNIIRENEIYNLLLDRISNYRDLLLQSQYLILQCLIPHHSART